MKKLSAFTLVEMLMTVGIAVILIAFAAPSFIQTINNNNRTSQVNDFLTALMLARSEALKRGSRVGLCRSANHGDSLPSCATGNGWESGWVIFDDEDANGTPDSADDILKAHAALSGNNITLRGNSNVASYIYYAGNGRIAGGTFGSLVWCDSRGMGADARVISIPLSGRTRTYHGNDTDAPASCTP